MVTLIDRSSAVTLFDSRAEPVAHRPARDWTWLNWALTLLTPVVALVAMGFALHAALNSGGCGAMGCPELGGHGAAFNLFFYGAAATAALATLGSFFTARRPAGIVVPLVGLAVLLADIAAIAATFG